MSKGKTQNCKASVRKTAKRKRMAANACASQAPVKGSNIIALRHGDANTMRPAFPRDHSAKIVFFTGVQYVRNGTQG